MRASDAAGISGIYCLAGVNVFLSELSCLLIT